MDDPNKNGGPALPSDAASPTAQSSRPTELISEPALPTSGQGNQDTGAKKSPANGREMTQARQSQYASMTPPWSRRKTTRWASSCTPIIRASH
jgi:hypothetical protein